MGKNSPAEQIFSSVLKDIEDNKSYDRKIIVLDGKNGSERNKKIFPDYEFDDFTYIYDGQNYDIVGIFENYEDYLTRNYTRYYSVTYKVNGVKAAQTTIKNVGDYVVTATYSEPNYYVDRTFVVNISIINSPGEVDNSKETYQITSDLLEK